MKNVLVVLLLSFLSACGADLKHCGGCRVDHPDLAQPPPCDPDMATSPVADMAATFDMTAPDLATAQDMVILTDMERPVDLAQPLDLLQPDMSRPSCQPDLAAFDLAPDCPACSDVDCAMDEASANAQLLKTLKTCHSMSQCGGGTHASSHYKDPICYCKAVQ